jgi:putative ABC transport system permease protein
VSFLGLVLTNLFRNKKRTFLTMLSVTAALFLYCALGGVLDTLNEAIQVGSETRMVTRHGISLVFPLPISYLQRIQAVPGVKSVAVQNWFGGRDPKEPSGFFAQFAVDDAFLPMYAKDMQILDASPAQPAHVPDGADPRLAAFLNERTACIVGEKLFRTKGWRLGQTVTLAGTIYPGDWPFTIRAVYRSARKGFNDETLFFRHDYLAEKSGRHLAGVFVLELQNPEQAGDVAKAVDAMFENSSAPTHTEPERAFQAGFVSMYGNIPFALRIVGLAVVFTILLIAANTMMMAFRERITEIGVLKTLGFEDGTVFGVILAEAAVITLGGGVLGALAAKFVIEGSGFNAGGMLPPMSVHWNTVAAGIAIAVGIGAVSGLLPAWQASRLRIVDALRRV